MVLKTHNMKYIKTATLSTHQKVQGKDNLLPRGPELPGRDEGQLVNQTFQLIPRIIPKYIPVWFTTTIIPKVTSSLVHDDNNSKIISSLVQNEKFKFSPDTTYRSREEKAKIWMQRVYQFYQQVNRSEILVARTSDREDQKWSKVELSIEHV